MNPNKVVNLYPFTVKSTETPFEYVVTFTDTHETLTILGLDNIAPTIEEYIINKIIDEIMYRVEKREKQDTQSTD
jgi:hypothetical protein